MKDWNEMTLEEREAAEAIDAETPGLIVYVIAHLTATPEKIKAAAEVLQEIKEADPELWTLVSQEEILYLLEKRVRTL